MLGECVSQVGENAELHESYVHNCKISLFHLLSGTAVLTWESLCIVSQPYSSHYCKYISQTLDSCMPSYPNISSEPEFHSMRSQMRGSKKSE